MIVVEVFPKRSEALPLPDREAEGEPPEGLCQKFINDKSISNKLTNNFNIMNNVIKNNLSLYVINNDKNITLNRG